MTPLIIAIVVAVVVVLLIAGIYNTLVALRNQFKNAFSQIDVQLKRRYDLIPNLVETAKAYLSHERQTLEAVIAARNSAYNAHQQVGGDATNSAAITNLSGAEGQLTGALGRLMAVAENYPNLKADTNMRQLSEELTSTENKVSFARQAYNDAVMRYNTARETFPNVAFTGIFGFTEASAFEISNEAERQAPQVKF
jgi:LemA protein